MGRQFQGTDALIIKILRRAGAVFHVKTTNPQGLMVRYHYWFIYQSTDLSSIVGTGMRQQFVRTDHKPSQYKSQSWRKYRRRRGSDRLAGQPIGNRD